jgi:hypothetical protein
VLLTLMALNTMLNYSMCKVTEFPPCLEKTVRVISHDRVRYGPVLGYKRFNSIWGIQQTRSQHSTVTPCKVIACAISAWGNLVPFWEPSSLGLFLIKVGVRFLLCKRGFFLVKRG